MPKIYGQDLSPVELKKRIGDISQIAGATPFCYTAGKAKGTAAIEVRNGSGLRFIILPDRGMDIAYAEFNGIPISYVSKTGVVAPTHYEEPEFLRSFTAGLLTTCGLTYMGAPCVDQGRALGAHGRISNTPAYDVGMKQEWMEDDYVISVRGKVREATVFGENLVLTRTVTAKLCSNTIKIEDAIENEGFAPAPLMVLYHMNFGFPLISSKTVLKTNCVHLRARDAAAQQGVAKAEVFEEPVCGYCEQVFYCDAVLNSYAILQNPTLGLAVKLSFSGTELPHFIEWKQMGEQEYVVGLEPATWFTEGRAAARKQNALLYLQPQEVRRHALYLSVEKNNAAE